MAGATDVAPPTGGSGAPVAAKPADVVIRAADVKSIQSEFGSHSYAVEEEVRSLRLCDVSITGMPRNVFICKHCSRAADTCSYAVFLPTLIFTFVLLCHLLLALA